MTPATRIAAAAFAAMLFAAPAMAQTAPEAPPAAEAPPARGAQAAGAARVTAAEAIRAVEAAGFRGVTGLEWERGAWEVKAHATDGTRARLMVDATTGAVTRKPRR